MSFIQQPCFCDSSHAFCPRHDGIPIPDFIREGYKRAQTKMRRFVLERTEDVSGISGTGTVAEGVQFEDGTVVLEWKGKYASIVIYHNIAELEHIHSHEGRTKVVWIDEN